MPPALKAAVGWIGRRAENVVAGLLGIMFVAFIVQIAFRYLFDFPIGWSSELSVIAWLYMVLIGSAFWLKERETIRFDLVTGALGRRGRRIVGGAVALAAVILFAISFPAAWSYVTFMKVEPLPYMQIRKDIVYSVYLFFAAAMILRYGWRLWQAIRGDDAEERDATGTPSGL
jgi:TRAP-type C4-dicarboxylate transport system permease small subunit